MITRPPIGFIVEGHGEYNCYPSLFCRIVGVSGLHTPCVNAGGCGSVVMHLKEQLTDLFLSVSPISVIITVDLEDVLKQGLATTCAGLLQDLNGKINEWKLYANNDERLHPLPDRIICVVQIKKFESWLISDIGGLKKAGLVDSGLDQIEDAEMISCPDSWLGDNLIITGSVKNPRVAKSVISALRPDVMRMHSRSFDKFFRESVAAYDVWMGYMTGS